MIDEGDLSSATLSKLLQIKIWQLFYEQKETRKKQNTKHPLNPTKRDKRIKITKKKRRRREQSREEWEAVGGGMKIRNLYGWGYRLW